MREFVEQLRQIVCESLPRGELRELDHYVHWGELRSLVSKTLPAKPLNKVSVHGSARSFLGDDKPKPWLQFLSGQRKDCQIAAFDAPAGAGAEHSIEVALVQ